MKLYNLATTMLCVGAAMSSPAGQRQSESSETRQSVAKTGGQSSQQGDAPFSNLRSGLAVSSRAHTNDLTAARIILDQNGGRAKSRAWAGAVQSGTNISEVQGTIRVPLMMCEGGAQECSGFAWVGIDGENCPRGSLLQTGVAWFGQTNGSYYKAAFEWLPNPTKYFDIELNPQDIVTMKVVAHNATSGTAYINNESTGESASHDFSGELPLCQNSADWIVEDFTVKSADGTPKLDNFARFNDLAFANASYVHTDDKMVGDVQQATMVDMVQGPQGETTLVGCETAGADVVHCQYAA